MSTIRRGLLLFWALWLTVVTLTNGANALSALGVLPADVAFSSGNWAWINQTMAPRGVPLWLQAVMFGGIICWEALAAGCFWVATVRFRGRALSAEPAALTACIVNLSLWAAFNILDEVFLAFGPEAVHRVIFANMLLTVIALHLLPHDAD